MATIGEQLEDAPKAVLMEYAGHATIGNPVTEVQARLDGDTE